MKEIFERVKTNHLFQGIALSDFSLMLNCLSAKTLCYKKGDIILLAGNTINFVGLVLYGSVKVIKEDIDGRITILTIISVSEIFGEVFACAGITQSPITIQAAQDTKILYIDYKKVITICSAACPFHATLIKNMLKLIADKNLILTQKNEILSKRTTREKLMCYFNMERGAAMRFSIPFNREELANYLCVERSAMSKELCKMRDEGIIRFNRNNFEIIS
ncbi:MAG: Crp/Fnr family transcriptional regulator [Defluviitaleaceae bacterium]|nr:Crp/Fnr family transcriptional regulator [Defluviitaleaceae bacterium]